MNIAYLALKMVVAPLAAAFEEATTDPIKCQEALLLEYLNRHKNTEYGKKHDFASIRTIADYQTRVPICEYEEFRPYVDRLAKGKSNILTRDRVIFFGATSGTTSKPKLIPVTKYSLNKKQAAADLWAYYIAMDHPRIPSGKVLAIISPEDEGRTESGIHFGAESGLEYKNLSFIVKRLYALPYDVFRIDDYESRYYCILRIGMEANVTTVATVNPTTIVLLCRKIDAWKEKIISDIENGTLNKDLKIPADIRKRLEKKLTPQPAKACELRRILKDKKELLPKDFWRRLELIECWKGAAMELYLKELPKYFGGVPVRDIGCVSTEARSSMPMGDRGADGVLTIQTNFYEFIRKEDVDKKDKKIYLCNELEAGGEYYMILTTAAGLYRYNIDDIIRVKGFFNKTPVIEFRQKGHNAVSLAGEKLYESQLNEAINRVVDKWKTPLVFFSACSQMDVPPRYAFLVEFDDAPFSEASKRDLLNSIERELRGQNREYKYVREAGLLGSPVLKVLKKGSFERYRAKRIAEGVHDAQFKALELTCDPCFQKNFDVLEEIRID